ncbi:MAG: 4-alpha-glucanotransferase, partial [Clostridia bacterium]
SNNPFLPHNFENNCVAYLGTHDNDTIIGWWRNLKNDIKEYVYNYTGFESDNEINRKMMKFLSRSKADVVIFAIQDVIGCDSDRRMNTPGVVGGKNWLFKLGINEFNENDIEFLAKITSLYSRKNEEIYN